MRKNIITIIGMALVTMGAASAQDLQDIMDKHFKAIGQENILKVKTQVSTGKIIQMGMELPFKSITKRPNKAFTEMDFQGARVVMAFDGVNGWAIQPWTGSEEPIDLAGAELDPMKELSDLDGNLWNYKEKGHQLELVGTEDLNGTKVYVLKNTRKDGNVFHYYLDSEKYIILKMKYKMTANGQDMELVALMSNYQDIDGYLIPFTTEQSFDGQSGMSIQFEEVKFNEDIDDSIFLKPATAPAKE
jgi:outer membrane lipoprotein-sorting protein